jgi:hypothetical protein
MADKREIEKQEANQRKTLRAVNNSFGRALFARQGTALRWEEYLDALIGDQQIGGRELHGKFDTVTNLLFSQVMTIVPILTANIPSVSLVPEYDTEYWKRRGKLLERLINRIFRRNEITERMAEAVTYSEVFGKGYFKTTWDKFGYGGFGDVRIDAPDPRAIILEPGKMRIRDMNMIYETAQLDAISLARRYPDRAGDIARLFQRQKAGQSPDFNTVHLPNLIATSPTAPGASVATTSVSFADAANMQEEEVPTVPIIEAWFFDEDIVDTMVDRIDHDGQPMVDPDTGKTKREHKTVNKYPDGRLMRYSGDTLFEDKANPFPGLPYAEFFNYFIPGEPYGMGDIEQALPIQRDYNTRKNQIMDWFTYNTHPVRFYDGRTGLDESQLTNDPNAWMRVDDVNGIREFVPRPLSVAAFESLLLHKQEIETIFGVREVTQGTIPGDIRSGTAIEALQEAADVRLRRKSAAIESGIKDMARFIINLIAQHYEVGIHYDDSDEDLMLSEVNGDMFDIDIRAGVNQPRSQSAQQVERKYMFEQDMLDHEAYYENAKVKLDNSDEIKARMLPLWNAIKEAKLAEAELAAEEAAEPAPPPQIAGPVPGGV